MTNLLMKSASVFTAFAMVAAFAPLTALAASVYTIDAPANSTITRSALIASNSGVASDSGDVAVIASSENSIEIALVGDAANTEGLSAVRINPTSVSGGSGTVQLWVHESGSDTWYDTVVTGWGPVEGFPITADYNESITVVAVADEAGVYTLDYSVVDVSTGDTVASGQGTLTVEEITSVSVSDEDEMNDAVDDENITTIDIDSDFTLTSTMNIDREVTVNGNNHTISVADTVTGSGILITADNVVVEDLTLDASGKVAQGSGGIQGVQVYVADNVSLNGVTAMNAGKSGIMVNGSSVTVTDVTTSNNEWHGINVDMGSGVLTPGALTVEGTSSHLETGPAIYIDTIAGGSVSGDTAQYTIVNADPATAYFLSTVNSEEELNAALDNSAISTITIGSDIAVEAAVVIDRAVTIDGNGKTLTGDYVKTSSSNNTVILVTASDVAISDLAVDGGGSSNQLHGINIYVVTGITLDGVTVSGSRTGINVNGSTVTVNDVSTTNNEWHGINVDQGTGVTAAAALTVTGTSSHDEESDIPHIWVDDITLTGVSVTDSASQYDTTEIAWDDNGTPRNGRSYTLKEEDANQGGGGGSSRRNNNDEDETVEVETESEGEVEGEVLGAATYNFTTNLTIGATGQDVTELQAILIAAGYLKIDAPTGYFGPLTAAAVKMYQTAHGISPVSGYVGPLTLAALNAGTAPSSTDASAQADLTTMIAQLQAMLVILQSLK